MRLSFPPLKSLLSLAVLSAFAVSAAAQTPALVPPVYMLATAASAIAGPNGAGAAEDANGNLYLVNTAGHQVLSIKGYGIGASGAISGGTVSLFAGASGAAHTVNLSAPVGVAVDASGDVFIADYAGGDIVKITAGGSVSTVAAGGSPTAVAVSPAGTVYFAVGTAIETLSGSTFSQAFNGLTTPVGLAFDMVGNVYVADAGTNQIKVYNAQAVSQTIAGTVVGAGSTAVIAGTAASCPANSYRNANGDGGPGTSALLCKPAGVVVDPLGNIYADDSGDYRIRKITPAGVISTVAGIAANSLGDVAYVAPGAATSTPMENLAMTVPGALPALSVVPSGITLGANGRILIPTSAGAILTMPTVLEAASTADGSSSVVPWYYTNTAAAGQAIAITALSLAGSDYTFSGTPIFNTPTGQNNNSDGLCVVTSTGNQFNLPGRVFCEIDLAFAPSGVGARTGSLSVASEINGTSTALATQAANLLGTGTGPIAAGTVGIINTPLSSPSAVSSVNGVAVNPWGGVYTSGNDGNISALNTSTNALTSIYSSAGDAIRIAFDPSGNLYYTWSTSSTSGPGAVYRMASTGVNSYSTTASEITSLNLGASPQGIAFDAFGNMFVADTANHEVKELAVGASSATIILGTGASGSAISGAAATASAIGLPFGVAVDSNENIYVVDKTNGEVLRVSGGIVTVVASGIGTLWDVALDPSGNLYVQASGGTYLVTSPASSTPGSPILIAGTGSAGVAASGDGGPANQGKFALAASIAIAPSGGASSAATATIYIGDYGANGTVDQIRTISTASGAALTPSFGTVLEIPASMPSEPLTLVNMGNAALPWIAFNSGGPFIPNPAWPGASRTVSAGAQIVDGNGNVEQVTVAGTTGSSTPTFGTQSGTTVTDGTATWTNEGAACSTTVSLAAGATCVTPVQFDPTSVESDVLPPPAAGQTTQQMSFTYSGGALGIYAAGSGDTANIGVYAGNSQNTIVSTAFGTTLQAQVLDGSGAALSGVTVLFTAPSSGASGTFTGGALTVTEVTNSQGIAIAPALTANATTGAWTMLAQVPAVVTSGGVTLGTGFSLTNTSATTPTSLRFGTVPNSAAGSAFSATVSVLDQNGSVITSGAGAGDSITISRASGPGSFSAGTFTATAVNGVATFPGLVLDLAGTYTLSASDNTRTIPNGASASFTVSAAAAAALVFTTQPVSGTVGQTFTAVISLEDQFGNVETTNSTDVILFNIKIGSTAVNGQGQVLGNGATTLRTAERAAATYYLTASDNSNAGVAGATSNNFVLSAGAVASIAVSGGNNQSAYINTGFGSAVVFTVADSFSNPVSGATVTLSLPGSGASASLSGGTTLTTNAAGQATTPAITANGTSGTYNVTGTTGSATANASLTNLPTSYTFPAIAVQTADPTQNVVVVFSSATTVSTAAVVTQGASGLDFTGSNTANCVGTFAAGATCSVTVTFKPVSAGQRLGGLVLRNASGMAVETIYLGGVGLGPLGLFTSPTASQTIPGLNIPRGMSFDGAGNGYVLDTGNNRVAEILAGTNTVQSAGTVPNSLFRGGATVVDGAGNLYATSSQTNGLYLLANGTANPLTTLPFQPGDNLVADAAGNLYAGLSTGNIWEIPASNRVSGAKQIYTGVGSQDFVGMGIDAAGNLYPADYNNNILYELPVGASSLTSLVSGNGMANPHAVALDPAGNIYVSNYSSPYGILRYAAGSYARTTLPAVGSRGLAIDNQGDIYTILADDATIVEYTRSAPPTETFATTAVGASSTGAQVAFENDGNAGLVVTAYGASTNFGANGSGNTCATGTLGAGAACLITPTFVPTVAGALSGTFTITDNTLGVTGTNQTFGLSGTGVFGAPAKLVFGTQPSNTVAGSTIAPAVTVSVEDASGEVITSGTGATDAITLSIASGPGTFASGTLTANAVGGVATFPNLVIDAAGTYTLGAADTSRTITNATSNSFTVSAAAAAALVFTTQPVSGTVGQTFTAVISLEDQFGNVETTNSTDVILFNIKIGSTAVNGQGQVLSNGATTLRTTERAAATYYLTASDNSNAGVAGATSNNFVLSAGAVASIAVSGGNNQSAYINTGFGSAVVFTVADSFSNPVSGATVTLSLPGSGASASLSGGTTLTTNAAGQAISSTITANGTTGSYNLTGTVGTFAANASLTNIPTTYTFGPTPVGTPAGPESVQVVLPAGATASVVTQGFTGLDFTGSVGTCTGGSFPTGANCVNVTFNPTAVGQRLGAILISSSGSTVGTVYLSGTGTAPLGVFSAAKTWSVFLGQAEGGQNSLVFDAAGNMYFTDLTNGTFDKMAASGHAVTTLENGIGTGSGVAIDGAGNIYYASFSQNTVWELKGGTGAPVPVATPTNPEELAVDAAGNLFIAAAGSGNVEKLAANGAVTYLGSGLGHALGLVVDASDNLYVSDDANNVVVKITPSNVQTTLATASNGLSTPLGMTADAAGDLYIANPGTNTVLKLAAGTNAVSTVVASGLSAPKYVALDGSGDLYVANTGGPNVLEFPRTTATLPAFGAQALNTTSAPQSVSFENDGNLPLTMTVTASANFQSDASATCGSSLASGATCNLAADLAPTAVTPTSGTLTVTDNSLNQASATQTVALSGTITQVPQTISFTLASPVTYGAAPITLSATGGASGNAVTFTVASGPGSISGNTLTVTGAGSIVVNANQAGNATYSAAPQVEQTLVVNKATLNVTSNPASITYGQSVPTLSASYGPFQYSDTAATALTGSPSCTVAAGTPIPSGNYTVTCVQATLAAVNYTFTFVNSGSLSVGKASATATLSGTVTKTYDGATTATPGASLAVSGAQNGDLLTLTYSGANYDTLHAGTGKTVTVTGLVLGGTNAGNYTLSNLSVSAAVGTINAATLTASLTGTVSKTYDGTTAATLSGSNYSLAGVLNSDVTGFNAPTGGAYNTAAVGTGKTVTVTGLAITNTDYALASTSASGPIGTIIKANSNVTWAPAAATITYGTNLSGILPYASGSVPGQLSYLLTANNSTVAGVTVIGASPTPYTIVATLTPTDSTDYNTSSANFTLTVNQAQPTINWTPAISTFNYGTPVNGSFLDATVAAPAGMIAYTLGGNPVSRVGTTYAPGVYTVTATFTPSDSTDYLSATATQSFTIIQTATALVLSNVPANVYAGGNVGNDVTVTVIDAFHNVVSGSSAAIAVDLTCPNVNDDPTGNAAAGVGVFDLSGQPLPAGSCTVTATSPGLAQAQATVNVIPTTVSFPGTPVGTPDPVLPVTILFPNGGAVASASVVTGGYTGLDFTGDTGACVGNQAAGGTCTVNVTFKPTAAGARNGAIVLDDASGNVLQTIYLNGVGQGAIAVYQGGAAAQYPTNTVFVQLALDAKANVFLQYYGLYELANTNGGLGAPQNFSVPGANQGSPAAFDGAGNLYWSDAVAFYRVPVVNGAPNMAQLQSTGNGLIPGCNGMEADGNGNIFIACGGVVKEFAAGGNFSAGPATIANWTGNNPQSMAIDGNGTLYMSNAYSGVLTQVQNPTSANPTVATQDFSSQGLSVWALGADAAGDVYFGNGVGSSVQIYEIASTGGTLDLTQTLTPVAVSGALVSDPRSIAFDGSGNMYVGSSDGYVDVFAQTAPPTQTFTAALGTTSAPQTVTLQNIGNLPLSINSVTFDPNFPNQASTCATSLASAASCNLMTAFTPPAAGSFSGNLVISDNSVNAGGSQTGVENGTGAQATPVVTVAQDAASNDTYGQNQGILITLAGVNGGPVPGGTYSVSVDGGTQVSVPVSVSGPTDFGLGSLTVGNHTVAVTYNGDTNYTSANGSLTIGVNRANPLFTDPAPAPVTYGNTGGVNVAFQTTGSESPATGSITYTVNGINYGPVNLPGGAADGVSLNFPVLAVGTYTLSWTYSGDGNFNGSGPNTVPVTVTAAATTIRLNPQPTAAVSYGTSQSVIINLAGSGTGAAPSGAVSYTLGSNAPVSAPLSGGSVTVNLGALAGGSYNFGVSYAGDGNYSAATATPVTLTVNPATPGVSVNSTPVNYGNPSTATVTVNAVPNGAAPTGTITYTVGGGAPQTATLVNGGATLNLGVLTGGNHALTVTYNGDTNYATATASPSTVTVNTISSTGAVAYSPSAAVAYGTDQQVTVTFSGPSGLATPTGTVTLKVGSNPAGTGVTLVNGAATFDLGVQPVATYSLSFSYAGDANYQAGGTGGSVQVTPAVTTVTWSPNSGSIVYGTNVATVETAAGSVSGAMSYSLHGVPGVGGYTIVGTFTPADTLNYQTSTANFSLTVTPAPLTVVVNNQTSVYGSGLAALTGTVTGVVNNDGITAAYGTTATSTSNVGSYPITAVLSPAAALVNYAITNPPGAYTITAATPTVNWSPNSGAIVYGTSLAAVLNAVGPNVGTTVYTIGGATVSKATVEPVGTYTITATFTSISQNFVPGTATYTLTVTPAPLTVVVNNQTSVYGSGLAALTGTVTGVVNNDGITAAYGTTATSTSNVGSYPITAVLSPAAALVNYAITNPPGAYTITAATPTVNWSPNSGAIVYGTSLAAVLNAVGPNVGTTVYTIGGATVSKATVEPVGTYTITATFTSISQNFVPGTATYTLTVTPAPLTITVANATRAYGAANPNFTGTITGAVNGDIIAATYATSAVATTAPGSYAITATPASTPAGALANYTITNTPGALQVTAGASSPSIAVGPAAAVTYGTAQSITVTLPVDGGGVAPTGTITVTLDNGTPVTIALTGGAATIPLGVLPGGGHTVVVSYNGNTDYAPAGPFTVNLAVAPASQAITFATPAIPVFVGTPVTVNLAATASSGLPVSYSVTGPATISGSTLTVTGTGTITITANQGGNGNYLAAAAVTDTVTAVAGYGWGLYAANDVCEALQMTGNSQIDSYNSAVGAYSVTHQLSGGNAGSNGTADMDGNSVIYGAFFDPHGNTTATNCGSNQPATATFEDAGDSAHVKGGVVTLPTPLSFAAPAVATAPTTNVSLSQNCGTLTGCTNVTRGEVALAPGTYGNVNINGNLQVDLSAGAYTFNSLNVNGNGVLNLESGPVTVNIAGSGQTQPLTFSGNANVDNAFTPANLVFNYAGTGQLQMTGGSTSAMLIYAPAANVTLTGNADLYGSIIAGTINVTGNMRIHYDQSLGTVPTSGGSSSNPALTAQTITFNPPAAPSGGYVYGGGPVSLAATASSGLPVSYTVSGPATLAGTTLTITGAGVVTVTANQGGNGTYSPAAAVTQSFTVAPAVLTITANSVSDTYGAVDPDNCGSTVKHLTYTITGWVNGDSQATDLTGSPLLTTSANNDSNVGTYTITIAPGTLAASNNEYTFNLVNGTVTVTKATLTVVANRLAKNLGQANPALTYTMTGFVSGDTAAVVSGRPALSTTATTNSPAGIYVVTISQGTLSATNYSFTFVNGALVVANCNNNGDPHCDGHGGYQSNDNWDCAHWPDASSYNYWWGGNH